jgi:hypothetical protein
MTLERLQPPETSYTLKTGQRRAQPQHSTTAQPTNTQRPVVKGKFYHWTLRNIPEELISPEHRGGSLKSRTVTNFMANRHLTSRTTLLP